MSGVATAPQLRVAPTLRGRRAALQSRPMSEPRDTQALLRSWHEGDARALEDLVEANLAWIRERVSRRLGPKLRRREDSQDLVQETLLGLLRDGPRFLLREQAQFRALMARRIENEILRRHAFHTAGRRDLARECGVPASDSVVTLDPAIAAVTRPSEAAHAGEMRALVALALELLEPDDRRILVEREYRQRSFPEIAAELGIAEDSARMRFNRALPRLAQKLVQLRGGRLDEAIGERIAAPEAE